MKKILFFALAFAALGLNANPVNWSFSVNPLSGNRAELIFSANIEPGWNMYAVEVPPNGPLPTEFIYNPSSAFRKIGSVRENPPAPIVFDATFEMEVGKHTGLVRFIQTIEILSEQDFTITGSIDYMVCDDVMCMPFDVEFSIPVRGIPRTPAPPVTIQAPAQPTPTQEASAQEIEETLIEEEIIEEEIVVMSVSVEETERASNDRFWLFIILAMVAGFAAVLTPCVFPLIPMTVSFFMSGESTRKQTMMKGVVFGLSVACLYSILGIIVAITNSPGIANVLSTHWIANTLFFILFIVFACSFFGLFEITLPASLSNKLDAKADKGGLMASFFMAAVLTIVSFSCTGPFVAVLLVEAARGTSVLQPILGMLAFGFALGLPFMLLSMAPSLLKKLPKSGGWLNSVKVVFAFVLLAFSMTFLLTIESFYGLSFFTREVYIGIWIVIFTLMGFYLLGKIKFAHDSDVKHVGVFRLFLVIATFSFVVYLIPGLFGAPLRAISGLIPTMSKQQFDLRQMGGAVSFQEQVQRQVRHGDIFSLPHGLQGFFDYEEGLAYARETGRPILLDFTGHGCRNCREMESRVWSDPEVLRLLNEFVIIALYTNDRTVLPEVEHFTGTDGRLKNTIGRQNAYLQITRFGTNTLPYYVVLDSEGNPLRDRGVGFVSRDVFIEHLEIGLGRR
ncbi:MAG: thioredoxin family protein [Bacteroidales bacterium]|nr:thioredoxin family protein [Bacteroidales bacterium]